jgi:hypothetical protein
MASDFPGLRKQVAVDGCRNWWSMILRSFPVGVGCCLCILSSIAPIPPCKQKATLNSLQALLLLISTLLTRRDRQRRPAACWLLHLFFGLLGVWFCLVSYVFAWSRLGW